MKIRPTQDHVWMQRLKPEKKVGSLFIPESAQDHSQRAKVLAVGPGAFNNRSLSPRYLPMTVKVGQVVRLPLMMGQDLKEENPGELILRESELLGVEES